MRGEYADFMEEPPVPVLAACYEMLAARLGVPVEDTVKCLQYMEVEEGKWVTRVWVEAE